MRKVEYISAFFEPFGPDSPLAGIGPADVHNRAPAEIEIVTDGAAGAAGHAAALSDNVVLCQLVPWRLDYGANPGLRRTYRRTSCLLARLLGNLGAASETPLLERFHRPVNPSVPEQRLLDGLYLDKPEEWDDPYRFFRW